MSHRDRLHAHAEQMRMRAALLRLGNDDANRHAIDLEEKAQHLDHLAGPLPRAEPEEDDYQ